MANQGECKSCGGPTTAYWRECAYCLGRVNCYSCGTWLERGDVEGGKHVKGRAGYRFQGDEVPMNTGCGGPARRPRAQTLRGRDPQRQKLYRAEDRAWILIRAADEKLDCRMTPEQAQEFARDVVAFLIGRPAPGVRLQVNRRRRGGVAIGALIEVGSSEPRRSLVIHEACHVGAREDDPGRSGQAHGPEFAACYLKAVRRFCGLAHAETLASSFAAAGVRFGAWR